MILNLLLPHILLFILHWECGNSVDFRFLEEPDIVTYIDTGQDLSLTWSFRVIDETMTLDHSKDHGDREFLFGEWSSPGNISNKILLVRSNTLLTKEAYIGNFEYVGNVSSGCSICCAEIKLLKLTGADCKTYGVSVSIPPKTDLLQSQTRIVLKQPAKIIKWPVKNLTVHERNAVSIRCKAEGQPPPLVKIQLTSETETSVMASGTGEVEWKEPSVKPKHEGTYHCVAYQDNVESDRKTMSLKVVPPFWEVQGYKTFAPPDSSASTIASSGKWILLIIIIFLFGFFRFHEEPDKVIYSDIAQDLSLKSSFGETVRIYCSITEPPCDGVLEESDKGIHSDTGHDLSMRRLYGVAKERIPVYQWNGESVRELLIRNWSSLGYMRNKIPFVSDSILNFRG